MWPKTVVVKGIPIQVASWEELDELIERYGENSASVASGQPKAQHASSGRSTLKPGNRVLLNRFVENDGWGVLNKDLVDPLGAEGKAIGPTLKEWSKTVGLTEDENTEAFESFNRSEGRGYKLRLHYLKVAQQLLAE